ncbi:MAG: molybdenum ABC transporter ATP-binding protein [Rhodospirillaceae bacterium]
MTAADETLDVDIAFKHGDFALVAKFSAAPGLTAFFGRSGAGKSTLANLIAGLARPDRGRIAIGGRVLFDATENVWVAPEHRRIGYVFQESRLFPHMTVRGNLEYAKRYLPADARPPALDEIAELLNLTSLLTRRPNGLSGGEKQRVAIGRALLSSPRLLVMDEPLASLDAMHKAEILPYVERLRDDARIPIVYVSHAIAEVVRLADTMVILDDGATVASGGVEEIMGRLDLRPLTGRYEAGAVLTVTVRGYDKVFGLTELGFAGGRLLIPSLEAPLGRQLRMRIRARDVALSLTAPTDTSFLNILPATVWEIGPSDGPQLEVLLDVGAPLIARITRKSLMTLDLRPGKQVFAMIKAAAIDRQALGLAGTRQRRN